MSTQTDLQKNEQLRLIESDLWPADGDWEYLQKLGFEIIEENHNDLFHRARPAPGWFKKAPAAKGEITDYRFVDILDVRNTTRGYISYQTHIKM